MRPTLPWTPLLLGLLVVLAGCSSPSRGPSTTPTDGVPPTDTPSAVPVPGVTDGTLTNSSALLDAHMRSLRDRGFRLRTVAGDEPMRYAAEPGYAEFRIDPGPNSSNPPLWANETVAYARLTRGGGTDYRRVPRFWAGPQRLTGADLLGTLFNASTFRVTGSTGCDGRQCVVLSAGNSSRYEAFGAEVAVDGDGIVHRMNATYTAPGEGGSRTVEVRLRLTRLGDVAVERPDWVAAAIRRTG